MGRSNVDFRNKLEFDPNFKGPLKNRSCTDVCCFLLFIIFSCAWGGVAYFAYRNGDYEMFFLPRDSDGHVCGSDPVVKGNPYLFLFDLTQCADPWVFINGCKTPQVCIKDCPNTNWAAIDVLDNSGSIDWNDVRSKLICRHNDIASRVNSKVSLKKVLDQDLCAKYYIAMKPFYKRCVPTIEGIDNAKNFLEKKHVELAKITNATEVVEFLISARNMIDVVFEELYKIRYYLLGAVVIALLSNVIYIFLLRWISGIIVWLSIFALYGFLIFTIYFSYIKYKQTPATKPVQQPVNEHFDLILSIRDTNYFQDKFQELINSKNTWLYILIGSCVLFIILWMLLLFLRRRIKIAIALINEASRCISSIKSSLLFPILPWVLHLAVIAFAIVVGLHLWSLGDSLYKVSNLSNDKQCNCTNHYYWEDGQWCIPSKWNQMCHKVNTFNESCALASCKLFSKNPNNFVTYLFFFNIFAYFWSSSFISALSELTLALTFGTWYWTFHKRNVPLFTLTSAILRTIRYHLGTVAFGSLIIGICKFIRFLLEYIEKKCKKFDNGFTRAILWTFKCLFWCLHKFIAFINRNAYIMCAIHGDNFCKSARNAFSLLIRNAVSVVVVDKVADFILFLSKAALTAGICVASYFVFNRPLYLPDVKEEYSVKYPWVPIALVGVITYLIASTFFRVYSMAIDTLFLCFLEDCERNDGSPEKPYFMSKRLMKILKKENS